jgi:lysozyme
MLRPVTTVRSAIRGRAFAALPFLLAALFFLPGVGHAEASSRYVYGIDISHWQGSINWRAVGRTSVGFVIAKATQGRYSNDSKYTANRRGAKSQGIKFGAYHYAEPDRSYHDAIREADHFVRVAGLRHGDLIPVLDLESPGHMTRSQRIAWVKTWVKRVYARTGHKPMIYVQGWFWRYYMSNTTWFANNGYRLWSPGWGLSSPNEPASNWGGRGWSFWQYSGCGHVSGIRGCVDLDRANGRRLSLVTL